MRRMNFFTGACGWSYDDWSGSFYPEYTMRDEFLELYAQRFSAVEVASTAHKLPSAESIKRWRSRTPDDFKFALIAPRSITNNRNLDGAGPELSSFLSRCEILGGNLGPILFEFPYDFKIDRLPYMTDFIDSLPNGFAFAVELRRKRWINELFLDCLREKGVSLVHSDLPWMTGTLKEDTAPTAYIRFRGGKKHDWKDYSKLRIDKTKTLEWWARNTANRVIKGKTVFSFFSNNFEGHAPSSVAKFTEMTEREIESISQRG